MRDDRSCKERVRSGTKEIGSDSGAIDTVGPKKYARAFEMKETEMSERGVEYVAANGSSVKNYGEKKIVGYTDDGESVSMRVPHADVKKVECSFHEMTLGGKFVVLDGGESCAQNNENGRKTRIKYEEGQRVMYLRFPSKA